MGLIQSGPFAGLPYREAGVILADPPWMFKTHSDKGLAKSPEQHYRTMPINEIAVLPVRDLASDNCALAIWCTWPTIFESIKVIEGWGFKYSGLLWEW